jgi:predicted nucleic acid-binding protein
LDAKETRYSGVVDVGIVLVSFFDNPLREDALEFMSEVLSRKNLAAIPTSTFLGAYHIATRYLHCPKDLIAREIKETLSLSSPAFVEDISIETVMEAIDVALAHNLESWDGYLVSLARSFKAPIIYSLDENFKKVPDVSLLIPFPKEKIQKYHRWVRKLIREKGLKA